MHMLSKTKNVESVLFGVFVGLGSLYGDHELHDENMDRQAELRIVEKYLSRNLEILM